MGCNTSQELKAKKLEDDAAAGTGDEKNETEQTTPIVNGDASADVGNGSPSVEDSSAKKSVVPSSTSTRGGSESEQNVKNNGIQHGKQQQRSAAGDVINDGKHHNGLVNGDIKDVKRCDSAEISELNNVDIDGDDEDEEDEAKAAVKIQAAFRGHKVRATMKKSDDTSAAAATTTTKNPPAATDGNSKSAAVAAAADNVDPTKEELEAEFDPNDKELCDAALKIQATFRGHLSRKLADKKDADDVDIQEITKKVAEELDIDLTDPELNKAATKIQASFRGHKSRKDLPAN